MPEGSFFIHLIKGAIDPYSNLKYPNSLNKIDLKKWCTLIYRLYRAIYY